MTYLTDTWLYIQYTVYSLQFSFIPHLARWYAPPHNKSSSFALKNRPALGGGAQPKVWKGGGCASNMSWNYRWVLCSLPSSNFSSPSILPDCRWLIVQSFNIGSKSLRNFPHLLFVSAILVKLKMKLQKKISVAKKAVRKTKPVLIPTIKWTMTDNLCLLYAIWEMCTPLQKLILTVIQLSTCI